MNQISVLNFLVVIAFLFCINYSDAAVLGTIESNSESIITHDFYSITLGIGYAEPFSVLTMGRGLEITKRLDISSHLESGILNF